MNASLPETLCSRQPIFDKNLDVYAYELLFEPSDDKKSESSDSDRDTQTIQVILNAFIESPQYNLLDGKKAFINFTRKLLRNAPPVCENKVVIKVSENFDINESMVKDIQALKKSGYTIVLNGFISPKIQNDLFELVDMVKIDVACQYMDNVRQQIMQLKKYDLLFLADKIETKEVFVQCHDLGFNYFQGHFLSKPDLVKGKKIDGDQQASLRLINVLQDQNSGFDEIEMVIASSSVLTYKLLRLINSSAFSFPGSISSLNLALTLLGLEKVRTWGTILAFSDSRSKPQALCFNALIRGQMCRYISESLELTDRRSDDLFTLGILSLMDAFLDLPMQSIIDNLNLSEWLANALLRREGNMGLILDTAISYEMADFDSVDWSRLKSINLSKNAVQQAYQNSIVWTSEIMGKI